MRDTDTALATLLQQASIHLSQRQTEAAEAILRSGLNRWPDHPDLLKFLGSAREQAGDPGEAEGLYRRALAGAPSDFLVATQIGHLLRNQHRYGDAVAAFQNALTTNPNHADALHGLALTLHHAGRLEDALAVFDHAARLAPGHAGILSNRGLVLGDLGRLDEALASFNRAIGLQPQFLGALINRGVILHGLGRYEDALKNHDRALSLDPGNAGALANRGVTLQNLDRHDEALASFETALAIQPDNAEAWLNRGVTLLHLKRHDEALASSDRALALRPDQAQAWNNRATALHVLGRLDEALESFDRAVALLPGYVEAWNNRGVLLSDLGRPDEALESFARVQALDPAHTRVLRNIGLALFETHRIADGLATFAQIPLPASEDEEAGLDAPHRQKHDDEQRAYLKREGHPELVDGALYLTNTARLPGATINPASAAIIEQWRNSKPQVVVIDNFLTDEALAALRKFCLGSTVWRKTYEDGYLGAMPEAGFAVPLLAQVAEDLRLAYPDIFKNHPLRYLWAFKYDSQLSGTAIHADQAAVNVNFWITPDEANLDRNSGGLVVWDASAPLDWDFERFNCDETAMRDFLKSAGAKPLVIPHRANRAVIFDSDLFHETDKIAFKDGYENRRINITMLYGRRNA